MEDLSQRNHVSHPTQKRGWIALLRFHIHSFIAPDGIHDNWAVESSRIGARKPRIPICAPLHRRAHAVPIAQVNVVPHPNFITVIENWCSRKREEKAIQKLYSTTIVIYKGS